MQLSQVLLCFCLLVITSPTLHKSYHLPLCLPSPFLQCYASWGHAPCTTILLYLCPQGLHLLPLLLHLLWPCHTCHFFFSLPPFNFYVWTLLFAVPNLPISKTFHLFFYLLLSNISFTFPTSHHPACQYFILILGFPSFFLLFFLLYPAIAGQVHKPSTFPTHTLFLPF